MDTLSRLNCRTMIVKLKDLDCQKPYTILEAEKVHSKKYDTTQLKLKIELEKDMFGIVYLPARIAQKINDEEVKDIVQYKLEYGGMSTYGNFNAHDIKFIE